MGKRSRSLRLPSTIPAAAKRLLTRFPVASGHDASDYEGLLGAVFRELQPQGFIETIFAKDVADHTWEIQCLRSIETVLLTSVPVPTQQALAAIEAEFQEFLMECLPPAEALPHQPRDHEESTHLEQNFGDQHPENDVLHLRRPIDPGEMPDLLLPSSSSNPEPTPPPPLSADEANRLAADAFKKNSREIDQISRLTALAESRRNAALRELDRYRSTRTGRPQREDIIDVEYTEAPAPARQRKA